MTLISRRPWFAAGLIVLLVCTVTAAFMVGGPFKKIQTKAAAELNPLVVLQPQGNGYTFRRAITIDHTKVPNTDQSNFPVLISGTYSYLAWVANGGNVKSRFGYDVIFTSDCDCSAQLNHEVETYKATTGAVNYWVKVPTLSHTTDTVIYMCYGNAAIPASQQNPTGVWDANFKGIYHLKDGAPLDVSDSTTFHSLTNNSATATTAMVNGGASFDGSTQYLSSAAHADFSWANLRTVEFWMKMGNTTQVLPRFFSSGDGGSDGWSIAWVDPPSVAASGLAGNYLVVSIGTQATPSVQRRTPDNGTINAAGVWHHVAVIGDGTTVAAIYLDGSPVTVSNSTGNLTNTTIAGLNIGRRNNDARYFNGVLDELRLSNAQRSADWIKTEYNNQSSPATFYSIASTAGCNVPNQAPTVSLTSPVNNAVLNGPAIQIEANAADPDGLVNKVEFFLGDVKLGEDTAAPYSFNWTDVSAGGYTLTARATDNVGATTTSTAVSITVTVNQPPYVSLISPANNTIVNAGSSVLIIATAGDNDGVVNKVEFFQLGFPLGEDTVPPYTCELTVAPAGMYSLTARARDNSGAVTTSSIVSLVINRAPIANANGPYSSFPGSPVQFSSADSSDPDGWIPIYIWQFGDGTSGTGENPTHTYETGGVRTVTLTVMDFLGATGSATTTATITNRPPVADAGGPYNGITGTAIQFNGTNSSDPDGPIPSYQWDFGDGNTGTGASPWHTYTTPGPRPVTLTVTDNDGATASANTTANIANRPPVANANGPYSGFQGVAVEFSSANSSDPDGTIVSYQWDFGDGGTGTGASPTHSYAAVGPHTATLTVTDNNGATASAQANVTIANNASARLDPLNQTGGEGENPLSGNFNWSVGLVSLPGRAGLDLGLSLSYNSLVWTKSGSTTISFDDDRGFPSPGFRLGFPVIQLQYFNSQVGRNAFMLITPNGDRVELRQVGASNIYESADSSYLTAQINGDGTITVRTTDGTQLFYELKTNDYQCTKIKDRNGNFISVNYVPGSNRIDTVVDTLSRTITFNYDGNYLSSITQIWNQGMANQQNHEWASFTYNPALPIQIDFPGLTTIGLQNNSTLKVLSSVKLNNQSSRFDFAYTSWGQVWKISSYGADGDLLNYRAYNLPGSPLKPTGPQDDCPRFTERHDWAENWNGDAGGTPDFAEDAKTLFAKPVNASLPDSSLPIVTMAEVTSPDGTFSRIYFAGTIEGTAGSAPGWQRGLPLMTDTFGRKDANSPVSRQRRSTTLWQDDLNSSYPVNPRVAETNVYDYDTAEVIQNRKRTEVTYKSVTFLNNTTCALPEEVREYHTDSTTVLRRTYTEYVWETPYTDRHILGLVREKKLYEGDAATQGETLMSRVGFGYDESTIQGTEPEQHDGAYNSSFVAPRGNLTSVKRYDVTPESEAFLTSTMFYNATGSVVKSVDPANHQTLFSYTDQFAANGTTLDAARPSTLAYPTMVTDPDGYTASSRYHYDFGAVTWTQTPLPNTIENLPGPQQTVTYDSFGRIQRSTNLVNGAYTRYLYPSSQPGSQNRIDIFATIKDGASEQNGNEAHSFQIVDGHGRVIARASSHPGSDGGFSGQRIIYDVMGRVFKTSNPTETNASGQPSQWSEVGDDHPANGGLGWLYTQQTYDWKGRPLVTTNTDGTTKEANYTGCGCAGGEVMTLTDEGTLVDIDPGAGVTNVTKKRQQRIHSDSLGRTVKTEILNWDGLGPFGTGDSVYSTSVRIYNARDQVTSQREYQGGEASGVYHETLMGYDGYGRLKTKHVPEQKVDPYVSGTTDHTTWEYNSDDTVLSITDARGITTTLGYDGRRLLRSIAYPAAQHLPAGVPATANVTYNYDAAGNHKQMSDTSGNVVNYIYDSLSRLTSEARQFAGLSSTYTLAYEYNLAGQLKKVSDHSPGTGTSFSYVTDNVGRLSSIDSTGLGATSLLASNAQYRASGALKHRESGNGTAMDLAYNGRQMLTQYSLSGVKESNGAARPEGSAYHYYADGQVRFASDFYERQFSAVSAHDKSYQYDHVGRLQTALTGVMSNDVLNGTTTQFAASGSYMQMNTHDVWGNLTGRDALYWSEIENTGATIDSHNRNTTWSYDADGRLISMNEPPFNEFTFAPAVRTYDAAGEQVKNTQTISRQRFDLPGEPVWTTVVTIEGEYDGDGQQVKRVETTENVGHGTVVEARYFLRSSVLNGQVITEYGGGTPPKSYVYGDADLIATRDHTGLLWRYNNPVTGDGRETDAQGKLAVAAYLDPEGMHVGASDPANAPYDPGPPPQPMAGAFGAHFPGSMGGSGSCIVDGVEIGCGFADVLLGLGAAQCPDNNCNPRMTKYGLLPLYLFNGQGFGFFVGGQRGKGEGKSQKKDPLKEMNSTEQLSDEECDKRLSEIFGGLAKAMVNSDARGAGRGANGHSAAPRNDLSATRRVKDYTTGKWKTARRADRGGIIHVYTDANGTARTDTKITTPAGWVGTPQPYFTEGYSGLIVNYGSVTIEFVHLGTRNPNHTPSVPANSPNAYGLVEIGYAGGKGGDGDGYYHTHIVFFSNKKTNERIDPRVLFCGFPKEGQ